MTKLGTALSVYAKARRNMDPGADAILKANLERAERRGRAAKAARRRLTPLGDAALLARLARHTGRTVTDLRRQYRNPYASSVRVLDRDRVYDAIVAFEVPL